MIVPLTAGNRAALAILTCVLVFSSSTAEAFQGRRSSRQRNDRFAPDQRKLSLVRQQHATLREKFSGDLEELAEWCEERSLAAAAARVRAVATPVDPQMLLGRPLPEDVRPELSPVLPADERYWKTRLQFLQTDFAREVYLLSRRALNDGSPSYAYDLVREVARHDPDHRVARRLLGFVRLGEKWVTPYSAKMQRSRHVWHERFGWLPASHVERYEGGERFYRGRWMSARQEEEIRRDFEHAWEVRSEHFLVKTNHSLEQGVKVATALEDFYGFFFQVFAPLLTDSEQIRRLFSGGSPAAAFSRPHEVHYYRAKDEYISRLIGRIPQIAITNGLYYTTDRTSYFYHDPDEVSEATLFHEATHQLLYETTSRDRAVAQQAHFWVIEGIACYMESFRREEGTVSLGDPDYSRFQAARYRYLVDDYYVPLAEFDSMGMQAFQTSRDIARNYSQAAGLSHFFMHYDNGRYRDALVEHLAQHYRLRSRRQTLVEPLDLLTGTSMDELDREYGAYLKQMQDRLDARRAVQPGNGAGERRPRAVSGP